MLVVKVLALLLTLLTINSTAYARRLPILPFQVPISDENSEHYIFSGLSLLINFPFHIVEKLQTIGEDENAEELSGQFEGDIILSPEQIGDLTLRNGLSDEKYSWPNHTVVYEISEDFDEEQQDFIRQALGEMEAVTCLKFLRRTNEENFIRVTVTKEFLCSSPSHPPFHFSASRNEIIN